MTKFILNKASNTNIVWNGISSIPNEINVISSDPIIAEFELLAIICGLHGYITAFDILIGADIDTEKAADIDSVLAVFQQYIYPKMPISNYYSSDKRISKI